MARDGHVNVNQRERLVALRTLLDLIDHQPVTLPTVGRRIDFFNATQEPEPGPSQVRVLNEGGFEARVTEVTAVSGNVVLNAQPSDFAQADIVPGTWFELIARGQSYRVFYGRDFTSVKRGEWVAFPNADGFFALGRNHDERRRHRRAPGRRCRRGAPPFRRVRSGVSRLSSLTPACIPGSAPRRIM